MKRLATCPYHVSKILYNINTIRAQYPVVGSHKPALPYAASPYKHLTAPVICDRDCHTVISMPCSTLDSLIIAVHSSSAWDQRTVECTHTAAVTLQWTLWSRITTRQPYLHGCVRTVPEANDLSLRPLSSDLIFSALGGLLVCVLLAYYFRFGTALGV